MNQPERLTAASFLEAASHRPYLLVRVEPGEPVFHPGVAEFFTHQYPKQVGCAVLSTRSIPSHDWWQDHFQSAAGPMRTQSRTGYWLFQTAVVVGYHSGRVHHTRVLYEVDDAEDGRGQQELDWIREVAFGDRFVRTRDLTAAHKLISYFDTLVCQRQERGGFTQDGRVRSHQPSPAGVEPQPVPIPGASGDPFEILGIDPYADDDRIRAAYRERMKLNHPDKVAHMSAEIQAYAHAQTRVIKAAFDAIMSVRSSRSG